MTWKEAGVLVVAAFISGALASFLFIWGNNARWQFEYANLASEFRAYQQQVSPAVQMYNQAMQEQALQGPETPQEAQQ